jgi:hypothetical protein
MKRRGFTLLQTLLSLFIGGLISAIVFQQLVTLLVGQQATINMGQSTFQTTSAIDTAADHLRNADSCTVAGAGTVDSVIDAGTATSVTYYGDGACTKISYFLTNGTLSRTENNVTKVIVRNVSALNLTYYKAATYNTPWSTTTNPNAPTAAELPYVCGVLIDITTTASGVPTRMTTTVRLRNAPKKVNLSGL